MKYKRLTNTDREEYDPELDFCTGCKYYGEPNGCNRPNGTCDSYDRFIETYQRLEALEDKIESGTLIELPCKPGDTAFRLVYWGSRWNIIEYKVEGITFKFYKIYLMYSDGTVFKEIVYDEDKIKFTREEAKKKLKELNK